MAPCVVVGGRIFSLEKAKAAFHGTWTTDGPLLYRLLVRHVTGIFEVPVAFLLAMSASMLRRHNFCIIETRTYQTALARTQVHHQAQIQ